MKAPPRVLEGCSPVVAYFRASMMVVFPEPFVPTIRVRGGSKAITSGVLLSKDRILDKISKNRIQKPYREGAYPSNDSFFTLDMVTVGLYGSVTPVLGCGW